MPDCFLYIIQSNDISPKRIRNISIIKKTTVFRFKSKWAILVALIVIGAVMLLRSGDEGKETPSPSSPTTPKNSGTAKSGGTSIHTAMGVPKTTGVKDVIIARKQYELSYNPERGGPNWVCWNSNAAWFGEVERRQGKFMDDDEIARGMKKIKHDDYTKSGYDRGHMVRSEDRTATREDNDATFYMTNVLPQYHELNAGPWLALEEYTEILAKKKNNELYIVAGGIYDNSPPTLNDKGRVAIPKSTWKIVVVLSRGEGLESVTKDTRVIAVNMPNDKDIVNKWRSFITTVEDIQTKTGFEFLTAVPPDIRAALIKKRD
jgi:endonuclease G, mitochondrial